MRKGKIRWGAVLNAITGVLAIAAAPEVTALLPGWAAHGIAIATLVNATFIKPAVRTEPERVR